MGTWGPGVFDSDLACEVRDAFRDRISAGSEGPAATRELLKAWRDAFADPEDAPVLWLALAQAQWDVGRLQPNVLGQATRVLRAGTALTAFTRDAPSLVAKRRAALAKLERTLAKKQPVKKRIARRAVRTTEVKPGDLFEYALSKTKRALLWTVKVSIDKGGTCPVLELLDWTGAAAPTGKKLRALPARLTRLAYDPWGHLPVWFYVVDLARREDPARRYRLLAEKFKPAREVRDGFGPIVHLERGLDEGIRRELGQPAR